MQRAILAVVSLLACPAAALAQSTPLDFEMDAFFRDEWTRDVLDAPDQERWRLQVRPRLLVRAGALTLGAGAEFNKSSEENVEPPPALLRDNYDAEDFRLDLAFARLEAGGALVLHAGRFPMPVPLTEMLWDRDLRPQGGALTLRAVDSSGFERASLTALGARGSHAFEDDETEMLLVSGTASWPSGEGGLDLTASYLAFRDLALLEPMIRRQNSRVDGLLTDDYRVLDLVLRLRKESGMQTQVVAETSWNTAVDEDGRGLWLALVLGSTRTARAQIEYTFARVDRDATVAAYATDDFFWGTGWLGHRADLGVRIADQIAVHVTGQLQRFKDSPRPEERDHWVKRVRLDLRLSVD